jgi:cyclic-di-AMP phosphodiesterase PgpH
MPKGKPQPRAARRREVRRSIPTARQRYLGWLSRREVTWAILWTLLLGLVGGSLALTVRNQPAYRLGQVVTAPVVSRVSFEAENVETTEARRRTARQMEPAVYAPNTVFLQSLREKLLNLGDLGRTASITSVEQIPAATREAWRLTPAVLDELKRFAVENPYDRWQQMVDEFVDGVASIALLRQQDYERELNPTQLAYQIVIRRPDGREMPRMDTALKNIATDREAFADMLARTETVRFPRPLRETVLAVLMSELQPTYFIDSDATDARRAAAEAAVEPVRDRITVHQLLIPAGRKITAGDLAMLQAEGREYRQQLGPMRSRLIAFANFGTALAIAAGLWLYIYFYKRRIAENRMRGLAMSSLLLLTLGLAVFGQIALPDYTYIVAIYPILMAAIVVAIAYDQRLALAVIAIHAILTVAVLDLSVGFVLVLLTGMAAAVVQLHEVRARSKLMWVGLWTGLVMAAMVWLVGLVERPLHLTEHFNPLNAIGLDALKALGAAIGTGLLVQGTLPAIESVFKVTTSMTLKELNDASHPLLRRLAQEAPGTYQHSLRLADLTESAANAVGANGLLCRVGAMYHDVGKINKPAYFVENQAEGYNRHERLSPAMSLLIIVGHVKDGIEMAREYNLPAPLRHFIESHHGTTLVEYFYHAAKQQSDEKNAPAPTEFEFRYPGPKPRTREAAILMLGDAIESAARTVREPNAIRLEQLVHAIAQKRLMDGQFDESSLTLQELHQIEVSMSKTLAAIYHARVKYPTEKADDTRAAQAETAEAHQPETAAS